MSPEAALRAALVAFAPLTDRVPAERISVDTVAADMPRPYIVFSKQRGYRERALVGAVLAEMAGIDIQIVAPTRTEAIAIAEQVRAALELAGQPADEDGAGYDGDNDIDAEVVTVDWWL